MDLSSIYMVSPDWLKFVLVVVPCVMIYGIARVVAKSWTAIALARLQGQTDTVALMPPVERAAGRILIDERSASGRAAPTGPMDPMDFG